MGMLGKMFPGRKLLDESGEDADGQTVADPWDIDLDRGVVRLRPMRPAAPPRPAPRPGTEPQPRPDSDSGSDSDSDPDPGSGSA